MSEVRSLEFYSGIGGMHYALKAVRKNAEVLAAFDINTTANVIYKNNFPNTKLCQNNVQSLTISQLEKFAATLWTLSPPCQPFTKKGLQLGEDDRRTDSFYVLLENLSGMSNPPKHILLENVVGFELSSVHDHMVSVFVKKGYALQEFILNPLQLGIPNSRPRYYILATLNGSNRTNGISYEPPFPTSPICPQLKEYMTLVTAGEDFTEDDFESLFLSLETLQKHGLAIDLVSPDSRRSSCFTKSYGTFYVGCGSYLTLDPSLVDENNRLIRNWADEMSIEELVLKIRKFSPREFSTLMGFPPEFCQPSGISNKQMYRTLGNSINVIVVSHLLDYLLNS